MAEQQERSASPEMSAARIGAILDRFEIQRAQSLRRLRRTLSWPPMDVQICAGAPNPTPTPTFAREDVRTGAVQLVSKDFF